MDQETTLAPHPHADSWHHSRILVAVGLILATTGALLLRIVNHPQVFTASGIRFFESDAFYHMRRVFLALQHGFDVPEFDVFMNFPAGFHCNWPPLFDQLIAFIAWIAGNGHPSTNLVETVGAWVPPILGALTVPAVYAAARLFLQRPSALLAAALIAILPYHVQISVLGRPDHHVAVVFLATLIFMATGRMLISRTDRSTVLWALAAGILLGLDLLTWTGSILFVVVEFAAIQAILTLSRHNDTFYRRATFAGAGLFLLCGAVILPVASTSWWATHKPFSWNGLSHFHTLLTLGAATVLYIQYILRTWASVIPLRKIQITLIVLAVIASAIAITAFVSPALLGGKGGISGWLFKQDPLMRQVMESSPLTWTTAFENFTGFAPLLPLAMVLILIRCHRDQHSPAAILLGVWAVTLGACTLLQERFSDTFSILAAILIAILITEAMKRLRQFPFPRALVSGCIFLLITVAASWPTGHWLGSYIHSAPLLSQNDLYDLCLWIKQNTPPASGGEGAGRPTYSILSPWPFGNAIAYISQRPNVANNFVGWDENREANLAPCRFFAAENLSEAQAVLDDCKVRYIVVTEPVQSGSFAMMIDALGLQHEDYFERRPAMSPGERPSFQPTRRLMNTMAIRLFLRNGEFLDHFRLVYESPTTVNIDRTSIAAIRIFEYDRNQVFRSAHKTQNHK